MRSRRLARAASALILCAVVLPLQTDVRAQKAMRGKRPIAPLGGSGSGLAFRLGEGPSGPVKKHVPAPAQARPGVEVIGEAEAGKLLRRIPAPKVAPDDEAAFALREESAPPPRTGVTVAETFPARGDARHPDAGTRGPLEVLRHAPEGEVPLAANVSVTFSQPMVALGTQGDPAAQDVPVALSPKIAGAWRWVGTKTLVFEAKPRLPQATEIRATVPAGTRSATGGPLKEAVSWTFRTPPPRLVMKAPADATVGREPVIFLGFDQRVDPAAVLATVALQKGPALRLATQAEVDADPSAAYYSKRSEPGRWVALKAASSLPLDTRFQVRVGPKTPSLEGPRTSKGAEIFAFNTYAPLRFERKQCGSGGEACPPQSPLMVVFNNALDTSLFDAAAIRIEPEIAGAKVYASGGAIFIEGATKGRASYEVTVPGGLTDAYGQKLGRAKRVTFQIGEAESNLFAQGDTFAVLDPAGPARFPVYSVNHPKLRVRLLSVGPEHWRDWIALLADEPYDDKGKPLPGRLVSDRVESVRGPADELTETSLDLAPGLSPEGFGSVVLVVEPTVQPKERWRQRRVMLWLQRTRIGLDAYADNERLVALVSDLASGAPVAGAGVSLYRKVDAAPGVQTDARGLARLDLDGEGAPVLVARVGQDVAILPKSANRWGGGDAWRAAGVPDTLSWFVFDDRGLYRPGEKVHVKGWIRRMGNEIGGDVGPLRGTGHVTWRLRDSQGNDVQKGKAPLLSFGAFDFELTLAKTMNLGHAYLQLETKVDADARHGHDHGHGLRVEEFRRPEFEVRASASEGPHVVGGNATVTVEAKYYAGGGLPNAETNWSVRTMAASYTPPGRDEFTFGRFVPWWERTDEEGPTGWQSHAGKTDGAGRHVLGVTFDSANPPRPSTLIAEATVMDVNRQAWSSSAALLVHPADRYVGLRSDKAFVQAGEVLDVDVIVTDLDGKAAVGIATTVEAWRIDWTNDKGAWTQQVANLETCSLASAPAAQRCTFRPGQGGAWNIRARVEDGKGRPNETLLTRWVAGGKQPPSRDVKQERVTLIPERRRFKAGETARVLVLAPFAPAEGVMTLRRLGIVKIERFTMQGTSHTLEIPVDGAWTPNMTLQVDLVGATERMDNAGVPDPKLPKRPAFAAGSLSLDIPPIERALAVAVKPDRDALEPGAETFVTVDVKDSRGAAVPDAEVALVMVDEAVLALTGYRIPDPIAHFYAHRHGGVGDTHSRAWVLLASAEEVRHKAAQGAQERAGMKGRMSRRPMPPPSPAEARAEMADGTTGKEAGGAITLRTQFDALAAWVPGARTDKAGRTKVKVKLPDSLTRYRVTAIAVHGGQRFGSGESAVTARLPLMVRTSAPRFLNFGDRFELPVVLQNQTEAELSADVAVRVTNATLAGGNGRRVRIPAHDRVEVRFPAETRKAGTARFQVVASAGRHVDASEVSLPVWTPATTEAFATYGNLGGDGTAATRQPVSAPKHVVRSFGGLEITTSSTALQALTDAVLYLVSYPFECSEQMASRILAVAALRDVLDAFQAKGLPDKDALVASVTHDVSRLAKLQNHDGGFAFWRRGDESWPYLTVHVANALVRATGKGFKVPDGVLRSALKYLAEIEKHYSVHYTEETRRAISAYALDVRLRAGKADPEKARKLCESATVERLPLEALGWLLPTLASDEGSQDLVAQVKKRLTNSATETAGNAHFVTSYKDGAHLLLHSDRRVDGVVLDALLQVDPKNDLVAKVASGLLAHRKAGRWDNTQENAFVLLALDRYFAAYEATTPDFVARAWLGDTLAAEHAFKGRTTERDHVTVPMRLLVDAGATHDLTIGKAGPGRLYYRIGLQYAPSSLKLEPKDHGFYVARTYEAIDDPRDVRRDADGVWHVRGGASVRVKVNMVAAARRYHVALVDPLPAGFEAQNGALATTGHKAEDDEERAKGSRRGGWWGPWWEHENLRDERAEVFTSLLWDGVYDYAYVCRATTPGRFVVPPSKAEEMYAPETFGRGGSDVVVVE